MTATSGDPGDFGRRVAHRRIQLGLSTKAVAEAAGINVRVLEHLEEAAEPVSIELVLRLAGALETTPGSLLGAGLDRVPGRGAASRNATLEPMPDDECWKRLRAGGVGRLLYVDADGGPSALPVNYAVVDDQIVFRTAPDSALARAGDILGWVGFEVDHIDDAQRTGWSILVRGKLSAPSALTAWERTTG